ncbi:MAG TPA: ZIP family metal transporter [Gaiellaceae bacterium]|nr:ZIP family metal transporter [Gaiellaceae bacterium]
MSTLGWIVVFGLAMSALALVGGLTVLMSERTLARLLMPLVALAAGSLLGGAFFHMLPEAIRQMGNELPVFAWLVGGFAAFFLLEQYLHWHHCHRPVSEHAPLGYLILLADGLHNFLGGLAVGAAFVVDLRVGVVTWLVAAAHEVPQELGDFGILVHSGWKTRSALAYNVASALTFLVGGLAAFALSGSLDVAFLLPFAAGNFVYIAAVDLVPQITSPIACAAAPERALALREKLEQTLAFAIGLAVLLAAALLT